MTSDPGPGFRGELIAALNVIDPQIEGLDVLTRAGWSFDLTQRIENGLEERRSRRGLIQDVITALNVVIEKLDLLIADGWPKLPQLSISEALAHELQKKRDALEAAIAIFEGQLRASNVKLALGGATPKP